MRSKIIGDLGEIDLQRWATEAKLESTRPDKDRTGWDFILEENYPDTTNNPTPLDSTPALCTYYVQIKATDDRDKRGVNLTLKNMLRMTKSPAPVFILFIQYDGKDSAQRAYLVHVGDKIMSKTLKKAREVSVSCNNDLESMLQHKVWISHTDDDKLSQLNGKSLKEKIDEAVGKDYCEYIIRKMELIPTLGYEENCKILSVKFNRSDAIDLDKLQDFALGLLDNLPLSRFTVSDTRFGVPCMIEDNIVTNGNMAFHPAPIDIADVVMSMDNPRKREYFSFDMISPGFLISVIPKEKRKIRFSCGFIDLILLPYHKSCSILFSLPDVNSKHTLKQFNDFARFVLMIADAYMRSSELSIQIEKDGKSVIEFPVNANVPSGILEISKLIHDIVKIANYVNLSLNTMTSINDIFANRTNIIAVQLYLFPTQNPTIGMTSKDKFESDILTEEISTILLNRTTIGNKSVVVGVVVSGMLQEEYSNNSWRYQYVNPSISIAYERVQSSDQVTVETMQELYDDLREKIEKKGNRVFDLYNHLRLG